MTVIPGTPGTYMERYNETSIVVFPGTDTVILLFVPYLHIFTIIYLYSRGQILRTSFGKDQPSQRGCSKYHLEHQEKPYT